MKRSEIIEQSGRTLILNCKPEIGWNRRNQTWQQARQEIEGIGCLVEVDDSEGDDNVTFVVTLPPYARREICRHGRNSTIAIFDLGGEKFVTICDPTESKPVRTLTIVTGEFLRDSYDGIAELLTEHLRTRLGLSE